MDDMGPEAAAFIAQRRDAVARAAFQDLQRASMQELPDVLHRLAGKLGIFGHEAAGDAARLLMRDLRDGLALPEVQVRVSELSSQLTAVSGRPS